jgi:hypothetical protein
MLAIIIKSIGVKYYCPKPTNKPINFDGNAVGDGGDLPFLLL